MKKLLLFILILFISISSLLATSFLDYSDAKSWIPESLCIGMGNDKWAIGSISYNMDDQLTFSEHFYLEAPAWTMNVNLLSITNRGWMEGWSAKDVTKVGSGERIDGRYDVSQILLGLPLNIVNTKGFYLYTKPEFGLSIIGNQHYDVLQNTLHKIIKAAPLEVDYEIDNNIVKSTLNLYLEAGGVIANVKSAALVLALRTDLLNTIDFSSKQIIYGSVGLIRDNLDILILSLGYSFVQSYSGFKTQEVYHDYLRGPILSLSINSGLIRIDYTARLQTGFGFGVISVDVLSLFKKPTWDNSDIFLDVGTSSQLNCTFFNIKLGIPILDTRFSAILSTRFLSGNPSFKGWETEMDPKEWPRFKRSYSALLLGTRYEFDNKEAIVTPYSEITIGLMTWEVRTLNNMLDPIENEEKVHSIVNPKLLSFAADLEIGLKFIPSGALKTANSEFMFSIFSGFTFIHNSKKVATYLFDTTEDSVKIGAIIPRWGFGIEIGFDLT